MHFVFESTPGPTSCKAMSKMRAYQATQRLSESYNTKTKDYSDYYRAYIWCRYLNGE